MSIPPFWKKKSPFLLMKKHGSTCFEHQSSWIDPLECDEYQSSWIDPQGILGRNEDVKGKEPRWEAPDNCFYTE